MHITLISLCQKRAIRRTQALLDRYAVRTGPGTWMSPITEEALRELQQALRRSASRHTAVACYRNEGIREMALSWIVGRRQGFGPSGAMPVGHTRRRHPKAPVAAWVSQASLLAQVAGLAHDLGKASLHFQAKLKAAVTHPQARPIKDLTRHEWTSMKVLQQLRARRFAWTEAWGAVAADPRRHKLPFFEPPPQGLDYGKPRPLQGRLDALDFVVLTHHGLPAPDGKGKAQGPVISNERHTERTEGQGNELTLFQPAAPMNARLLQELARQYHRLEALPMERLVGPLAWWGLTSVARAALILADHAVSARSFERLPPGQQAFSDSPLKANTTLGLNGKAQLNQPLEWHLGKVGQEAPLWIHRMAHPDLPGLSALTRAGLDRPSGPGRFSWQDRASHCLRQSQETDAQPTLVFNLAGTGAGKTRMNMRAIHALTPAHLPMRVAAGFNLRTLTLQTHTAFGTQLGIPKHEMACVVGDRLAKALHAEANTDEDADNPRLSHYDIVAGDVERPTWMADLSQAYPHLDALIGAPVLVSTMDYLVNAGDPTRQAHQGHALLRLASSDLILDEVDSYDATAMIAVLRVVMWAGVFGRHVMVSSATLATPTATALFQAYQAGLSIWHAFHDRATRPPQIVLIDHLTDPRTTAPETIEEFNSVYRSHLEHLIAATRKQPPYRKAIVVPVPACDLKKETRKGFHTGILATAGRLHLANRWEYDPIAHPGKHVSFGVIRVARVAECVILAKVLANAPRLQVCAYHAGDLRLRRSMKERELDRLFQRNPHAEDPSGNRLLRNDPDIRRRVNEAQGDDVLFVVVATPVEEVGRDHDFDWAIIEPSSTHSLVQMAGRVNRHRLVEVDQPNVAILDINMEEIRRQAGLNKNRISVFTKPGNEEEDTPYALSGKGVTHTLHDLLNVSLEVPFRLDASLRFGHEGVLCPFAQLDDKAITHALKSPMDGLLVSPIAPQKWMTHQFYQQYRLREKGLKSTWGVRMDDGHITLQRSTWVQPTHGRAEQQWVDSALKADPGEDRDWWLCPSLIEVNAYAQKLGMAEAMTFDLVGDHEERVVFHARLGGYRKPRMTPET
jgi:CRISPR-associated endonuclease/helicase Cas3